MFQKVFLLFVAIIASLIIIGCEKKVLRKGDWDVNFTDITFVDAQNGWVVGEKGFILHTTDGGKSWTQQVCEAIPRIGESGVTAAVDLTSVQFSDDKHGWIVGDMGTVLQTIGGAYWRKLTVSGTRYTGVHFVDAKRGWIVGEGGVIRYTNDGGKTWPSQSSEFGEILDDVYFLNSREGWDSGVYGVILHTTDGGVNWNLNPPLTAHGIRKLHFFKSKNKAIGWAVGTGTTILHTKLEFFFSFDQTFLFFS